jgi:hypothetical protein
MASNDSNPSAASQPKMLGSSIPTPPKEFVASKEVMTKDEYDFCQTKSVNASITLDLQLPRGSRENLAGILSDRTSPENNRSLFSVDKSYNHESDRVQKGEEDKFTKSFHEHYLPALVGIADFDQSISGTILVFRLLSRTNPSGLSCFTFKAANLFRNIDSHYAGELLPNKVAARKAVKLRHNCFTIEDMECLDTTKGSFSIVFRTNRRAVDTLITDIVKNLPSTNLARGIELFRYEKAAKKKAVNSTLHNLNQSDFSSPTSSSFSSSAPDSGGLAATRLLNGSSVKVGESAGCISTDGVDDDKNDDFDDDVDDVDDDDDNVASNVEQLRALRSGSYASSIVQSTADAGADESDVKIDSTADAGAHESDIKIDSGITLPEEDTEILLLSISVILLKFLALHIVSFDSTDDPKVIFITNKDHLVVFTGVFQSISGSPLVPLTKRYEHNESNKT